MTEENGVRYVRRPGSPFVFEPPVMLGDVWCQPGVRMLAHSYMNSGRIQAGTYIGRYCSIGFNVTIGVGHHDMTQLSTSSWFDLDAPPSVKHADSPEVRVRIKNDVWIGDGVIVMNGVTIGNGAVIGAGAVVTKDVPDYAIVVGVPAKVLKYRFSQAVIDRLLKSRWWEHDDQLLKAHRLNGIEAALDFVESLPDHSRTPVTLSQL